MSKFSPSTAFSFQLIEWQFKFKPNAAKRIGKVKLDYPGADVIFSGQRIEEVEENVCIVTNSTCPGNQTVNMLNDEMDLASIQVSLG